MARRRQLEPPSPEALKELEEGFARENRSGLRMPIADVVGEAAAMAQPLPAEARAEQARDKADAARLRAAEEDGRLVTMVPVAEVHVAGVSRDRIEVAQDELMELATSIVESGLRLPIEVYPNDDGYALISGFRRLEAFRHLAASEEGYAEIPAFVRAPENVADVYVAMIEENEIRVGLSQYERGRAAAMAVSDGVFATLDEAVNVLFRAASKAKRSKIRSFAMIHEELADMLGHATAMNERQCLRLATALRAGLGPEIRDALEQAKPEAAEDEWQVLQGFINKAEQAERAPGRGGRPRTKQAVTRQRRELPNGIAIEREDGAKGFAIRLHGPVSGDMVDDCMAEIERVLSGPR
ncbi:ParB/RepB/Spo0J family partition protein [Marinovum algicola]|uniref:ParB/RepB/Spo0J family partition protein n=1 Tax=Marinovum algicola TaxID=42444 RepID=UPI0024B91A46|nr:ParB N-terminal domain-containing protein [Marinovum algicola]